MIIYIRVWVEYILYMGIDSLQTETVKFSQVGFWRWQWWCHLQPLLVLYLRIVTGGWNLELGVLRGVYDSWALPHRHKLGLALRPLIPGGFRFLFLMT